MRSEARGGVVGLRIESVVVIIVVIRYAALVDRNTRVVKFVKQYGAFFCSRQGDYRVRGVPRLWTASELEMAMDRWFFRIAEME